MRPLRLTLKGFCGIRDGLGRDEIALDLEGLASDCALVALIGANGRGKTTLIDNLHPYPVMPSRAGADGLGSFSYYEHLCLPEAEKELVWEHEGRRLRTHQVFRTSGRRSRTEAYLFEQIDGKWQPVRLCDGTLADGRTETYLRCVEQLLGSAETFFTSVFSAQGKRQLCAYRNAEIKTLLADLLGLEAIRALGRGAAETARLLKAAFAGLRQQQAALDQQRDRIRVQQQRLASARQRAEAAAHARVAAAGQVVVARDALSGRVAERAQLRDLASRRSELKGERDAAVAAAHAAHAALDERERAEAGRRQALQHRIDARVATATERRATLARRLAEAERAVQCAAEVRCACRRLTRAREIERQRAFRIAPAEAAAQHERELDHEAVRLEQRLAAVEREAGQASLRAADLRRRHALTERVPCAGTDLQPRCQLLSDARQAQVLIPSAEVAIVRLADERSTVLTALARCRAELTASSGAADRLAVARRRLQAAQARSARLAELAARKDQIEFAQAAVGTIELELAALPHDTCEPSDDERREQAAIDAALAGIARERAASHAAQADAIRRIDAALAALPVPFDDARLRQAERAVAEVEARASVADQAHLAAVRDEQTLAALDTQLRELAAQQEIAGARDRCIGEELGHWNLLAKCLSNDGVIALVIDDTGPALAALANDLLLACYGPRFTVSIRTLVETAKGEPREGFDIVVHDADSGQNKSVGLMSGGERVWIDEALRRAIALYLAQNSGRRYQVLFSDEADGALDPQRKRMFIAMKREVLRLGGYEQEFFVSQSPELAAMADAVIDLDRFESGVDEANRGAARLPAPAADL